MHPLTDPADTAIDPVTALADLVEEHYVLEDRAPTHAAAIRHHAAELAALLPDVAAVNARLHELVGDRHLSLRAETAAAPLVPPSAAGFAQVERLDAGIALLAVRPWFDGPAAAKPCLTAAATLVDGAEALLLDLRDCGGGDTATAALVHGWLLGHEVRELGRFERRGRPSVPYVSDPSVGHHFAGPVAILTSRRTFSGAEDLAYVLQALGRATVVGETTAGGAHPVDHFALPGGRLCQIPVARSVIDATGSSWEGVGVVPDLPAGAGEAPSVAVQALRQHANAGG